jgi:hypothetical protein
MAAIPEHLRVMLIRCAEDDKLVLTASCGCSVSTVMHNGEKLPFVDVCKDHVEDVHMASTVVETIHIQPHANPRYKN